jgi:hypothetical protein
MPTKKDQWIIFFGIPVTGNLLYRHFSIQFEEKKIKTLFFQEFIKNIVQAVNV